MTRSTTNMAKRLAAWHGRRIAQSDKMTAAIPCHRIPGRTDDEFLNTSSWVDPRAHDPWSPYMAGVQDYHERVVLDPEVRFGKPVVRGTRITVGDVLGYLAAGMTEDEALADFPQLARDDLRACLAFAADRERRSISLSAT